LQTGTLRHMSREHEAFAPIARSLKRLADGAVCVLANEETTLEETSGTAMSTSGIHEAVRKGWLKEYVSHSQGDVPGLHYSQISVKRRWSAIFPTIKNGGTNSAHRQTSLCMFNRIMGSFSSASSVRRHPSRPDRSPLS